MGKTWVADSAGEFKAAKAVWIADAAGEFKHATAMWVADAAGTFQAAGVGGPSVTPPTVVAGSPAWSKATLNWSGTNATNYKVFRTGSATALYDGAGTSVTLSLTPSTAYSFWVRATDALGTYVDSALTAWNTAALPYPTGLSVVSGTLAYNDFDTHWNAVADATGYELQHTSGAVVYNGTSTGPIDHDPVASTTYYLRVRAKLGSATSGWSPTLTVTTPAPPGPAAGAYTYKATSAYTWQTASGGDWRASADGLYHGNGSAYGSSRGNQTGYFFYGSNRFDNIAGGTVTKFEVYLYRTDDSGASAGQDNRFVLHPYTGKPGGDPTDATINSSDAGTLARGEGKWIVLPTSWGQKLVDNTSGADGIGWGGVSGRYMHAAPLSSNDDNGKLRITIS